METFLLKYRDSFESKKTEESIQGVEIDDEVPFKENYK